MEKLDEIIQIDDMLVPQDVAAGVTGAVYFDMAEFRQAIIIINAALGAAEECAARAYEATDAAGTSADAIGDGITLDDAGIGYIQIDAADLADDHHFIGINLDSDGDSVYASATIIRSRGRFNPVTQTVDDSEDAATA